MKGQAKESETGVLAECWLATDAAEEETDAEDEEADFLCSADAEADSPGTRSEEGDSAEVCPEEEHFAAEESVVGAEEQCC